MVRVSKKQKVETKLPDVMCEDCMFFTRDTEGISRTLDGVYFMGICTKGLTPDSPKKQFADKVRQCRPFRRKE